MGEVVERAEPENIQAVVTKRETNDRAAVSKLELSAVQMRVRQMLEEDQMDSMFGEKFLRRSGPVRRPAQARHLAQEFEGHSPRLVGGWHPRRVSPRQRLPAPGIQ